VRTPSRTAGLFCSLPVICISALCVRLAAMRLLHTWPMNETSELWKSGLEIINIATSLQAHRGFSSPFGATTGPTAWIPPVYPYLVATIFRFLGPRSNQAAVAILTMQAFFSALTCIPIYRIGMRAFDERIAVWSTWGWALFPSAVIIPVLFVWETAMSAFLMTFLVGLCLDLRRSRMPARMLAGASWGLAALTNTALLAALPALLICPYTKKLAHLPAKAIATVLLVAVVLICPWIFRNDRELGTIVPVRSNFGEELWVGNHEGGTGRIQYGVGPSENRAEFERYRRLGEISYVTQRRKEAITFIRGNRALFFQQSFYRLRYWWFAEGETSSFFDCYRLLALLSLVGIGFALWKGMSNDVFAIAMTIALYPLIYYATNVYARYRYPVEPLMMIFAAFAISQTLALIQRRSRST